MPSAMHTSRQACGAVHSSNLQPQAGIACLDHQLTTSASNSCNIADVTGCRTDQWNQVSKCYAPLLWPYPVRHSSFSDGVARAPAESTSISFDRHQTRHYVSAAHLMLGLDSPTLFAH
eukprot:424636-Rhodomonas_salina.1